MLALAGEPGIGKTRAAYQFTTPEFREVCPSTAFVFRHREVMELTKVLLGNPVNLEFRVAGMSVMGSAG